MTNADVVRKIVGPIDPNGNSDADEMCLQNMDAMCDLIRELIQDVEYVSRKRTSMERSVSAVAINAHVFLSNLKSDL